MPSSNSKCIRSSTDVTNHVGLNSTELYKVNKNQNKLNVFSDRNARLETANVIVTADVHNTSAVVIPERTRPVTPRLAALARGWESVKECEGNGGVQREANTRHWSSLETARSSSQSVWQGGTRRVKSYEERLQVKKLANDPLSITEFLIGPCDEDYYYFSNDAGASQSGQNQIRSGPHIFINGKQSKTDVIQSTASNAARHLPNSLRLHQKFTAHCGLDSSAAAAHDTTTASAGYQQLSSRNVSALFTTHTATCVSLDLQDRSAIVVDCEMGTDMGTGLGTPTSKHDSQSRRNLYRATCASRDRQRGTAVVAYPAPHGGYLGGVGGVGAKTDNSFDSIDCDRSSSSHTELRTTSIESTTTVASTDSVNDTRAQHKLSQTRGDDSGYKSLEAQQSLITTVQPPSINLLGINTLEVPRTPSCQSSALSLNRLPVKAQLPGWHTFLDNPKRHPSIAVTHASYSSFGGQSVDTATETNTSNTSYQSLDIPRFISSTRHFFSTPASKTASDDIEFSSSAADVDGEGPDKMRRLSIRKALSQDIPSVSASGKEKPWVSHALATGLGRLRQQAGQYISNAVSQAESLFGHVVLEPTGSEHLLDEKLHR